MVFLLQFILRLFSTSTVEQVKPFTLHFSLLALVFVYAFIGGVVFNKLEADAVLEQNQRDFQRKLACVTKVIQNSSIDLLEIESPNSMYVDKVVRCFHHEVDVRSKWNYVTATLYGFGIVTTLGYNRIAPVTLAGRLFCVIYGLCGIPCTMILETYRERRRRRASLAKGEEIPESSIEFMSFALLISFVLYVCLGAILLPLLNGELDFFNGIYFNFLCLTAIDFGQLVPARSVCYLMLPYFRTFCFRVAFLPITFLYVCFGLAITTIAIDVGSEYMKKLHHFGKKMRNVATTKIWFGGKTWVNLRYLCSKCKLTHISP
ncbi:ion channel domain-containing protein [Ditylenchus destructor]|nr:ion channel domain-containing protein [Ditylenchus destructor]